MLINLARLSLLIRTDEQEARLMMTDQTASIDASQEAERAIAVIDEVSNMAL